MSLPTTPNPKLSFNKKKNQLKTKFPKFHNIILF